MAFNTMAATAADWRHKEECCAVQRFQLLGVEYTPEPIFDDEHRVHAGSWVKRDRTENHTLVDVEANLRAMLTVSTNL